MLALKRVNRWGLAHPWRSALVGFLLIVLIAALLQVVFHRNTFTGLFGAFGVLLGSAFGTWARQKGRPLEAWQKAWLAVVLVGGFMVLGLTMQVTGLLPR